MTHRAVRHVLVATSSRPGSFERSLVALLEHRMVSLNPDPLQTTLTMAFVSLLAVAAYNAGSGAVRRAGYKVPGGSQVQRYVWKVYYRYKQFAPDMF